MFIFSHDVGTKWCLAMGQDRFCAAWLMFPLRTLVMSSRAASRVLAPQAVLPG